MGAPLSGSGSRPADQAPVGLGGSRFDPSRDGAAKVCPPIIRYCKRGHLRTEASTFPKRARINGKTYIVRECRACHAEREKARYYNKWMAK